MGMLGHVLKMNTQRICIYISHKQGTVRRIQTCMVYNNIGLAICAHLGVGVVGKSQGWIRV